MHAFGGTALLCGTPQKNLQDSSISSKPWAILSIAWYVFSTSGSISKPWSMHLPSIHFSVMSDNPELEHPPPTLLWQPLNQTCSSVWPATPSLSQRVGGKALRRSSMETA